LFLSIATFTFVVYLFTGLLGSPLSSISALLPPQSASQTYITGHSSGSGQNTQNELCGPAKYADKLHLPHGLNGYFDYEQGMACAEEQDKPAFLVFKGHACANCKKMENSAIITSQGAQWVEFPSYITTFFQVIIGVMIGGRFKREQLSTMKSLLVPGILSSVWMIAISLAVGFLLTNLTGIDLGTALYGSVPGGLFEMGLIALTFNLSVPIVTLLQFVRILSINISLPLIVSKCNNSGKEGAKCQIVTDVDKTENSSGRTDIVNIMAALLLGGIGGYTASYLGLPVGGMLGAMIVVAFLRTIGVPIKELPTWLIICTQIVLGGYLGTTFTPEMVSTLQTLLVPILFFSIFVVINGIFVGLLFHRILKWDLATSLLSTAAGGVTLMTLTAMEINADPVRVSILHSLRLAIILLVMPTLIAHIIG
ncbi:MAG: AbrB family transcriptional regulator, partial [Bacteroidales bacterium]